MSTENLSYSTNNIELVDLTKYLNLIKNDFPAPLDEVVDLKTYSEKMWNFSELFLARKGSKLIGFISCYFNDLESKKGYITSLHVQKNYRRKGVANCMISNLFLYGKRNGFISIDVEVQNNNCNAIAFYNKLNFTISSKREKSMIMTVKI